MININEIKKDRSSSFTFRLGSKLKMELFAKAEEDGLESSQVVRGLVKYYIYDYDGIDYKANCEQMRMENERLKSNLENYSSVEAQLREKLQSTLNDLQVLKTSVGDSNRSNADNERALLEKLSDYELEIEDLKAGLANSEERFSEYQEQYHPKGCKNVLELAGELVEMEEKLKVSNGKLVDSVLQIRKVKRDLFLFLDNTAKSKISRESVKEKFNELFRVLNPENKSNEDYKM